MSLFWLFSRLRGRRVVVVALAFVLLVAGGGSATIALSGGAGQEESCRTPELILTVTASPDIAPNVERLANSYNASDPTVDNQCVSVSVISQDSSATVQVLSGGGTVNRPDMWVPDSSLWLAALRATPNGSALVATDRPVSLAQSPVVIAMPRPMAEALGWPARQPGWTQILQMQHDPGGWGRVGHPEWGPVMVGLPNPLSSAAGMSGAVGVTTVAEAVAPQPANAPVPPGVPPEILRLRLAAYELQRAAARDIVSAKAMLEQLRDADRNGAAFTFVHAFPAAEHDILEYNRSDPAPNVPLVAVYPPEAPLALDYPLAILRQAGQDSRRITALFGFEEYLKTMDSRQVLVEAGFRIEGFPNAGSIESMGLLPIPPATGEAPNPEIVAGLRNAWAVMRRQGQILTVMDVSGSMAAPVPDTGSTKLQLASSAVLAGLPMLGPGAEVGLWAFSDDLDGDKDYRSLLPVGPIGDQARADALAGSLASLRPLSGTGLYDTTLAAVNSLRASAQPDKVNAIVLMSDGRNEDDPGSMTLEDLLAQLRAGTDPQRHVRVIAIGYGEDADMKSLRAIAEATEGVSYHSKDPRDIGKVFLEALSKF